MKNIYISVDVETNGPVPGIYSMISLGAVQLDDLSNTFYVEIAPITENFQLGALEAIGIKHADTLNYGLASIGIHKFVKWLEKNEYDRLTFVSDNAGFDWQFVNYYLWKYANKNPFGYSPMSITWLYKGLVNDMWKSFRHLRDTKHTHNALDDALGNAEALLKMNDIYKLGLIDANDEISN